MADDIKTESKSTNKTEAPRSAVSIGEDITRTAAEIGSKITENAADTGTRFAKTTAARGAEFGQNMTGQASAMSHEFMRIFADMKLPGIPDMAGLMDAHRRNLEAISAANRVAMEGAQAVARRNMEIAQQTMQALGESMRQLASTESPHTKAAQHTEMLKTAYEQAVANLQEIRDLIQRANGEALELLNRRFVAAMDETKALIEKSQSSARPV